VGGPAVLLDVSGAGASMPTYATSTQQTKTCRTCRICKHWRLRASLSMRRRGARGGRLMADDDLDAARKRRQKRRVVQPAGAFGPSTRKQIVIDRTLAKVDAAAERRNPAAYYAGKTPTPERITTALDIRQLYGPEVDQALGGEEPMVDEWEAGVRVPTFEQMQRLAVLTGFPVKFFYLPAPPALTGGWMCGSGGCQPLGVPVEDECPTCGKPRLAGSEGVFSASQRCRCRELVRTSER
jgi:hypothetical protein